MISALTPLEFLSRNAIAYRDCTAEVDGDRRFTYSQMQRRVQPFGAVLQQAGIASGDRVAVLARNGLLPLEAHFAVPLIGAVLVTLNIRPLWLGRARRRRGAHLHLRAGVVISHLSLRTEDVRDDGVLGDRGPGSRSTTIPARVC